MSVSQDRIEVQFRDPNEIAGFTQIPNVVLTAQNPELTVQARQIYYVLRRYASMPNGARPSRKTIAKQCGWESDYPVKKHLPKLVKFKLISVVEVKGEANRYIIEPITQEVLDMLRPYVLPQYREENANPVSNEHPVSNEPGYPVSNDTGGVVSNEPGYPVSNEPTNNNQSSNTNPINNETNKQTEVDCLIDSHDLNDFFNLLGDYGIRIKSRAALRQKYIEALKVMPHVKILEQLQYAYDQYGKDMNPASVLTSIIDGGEFKPSIPAKSSIYHYIEPARPNVITGDAVAYYRKIYEERVKKKQVK